MANGQIGRALESQLQKRFVGTLPIFPRTGQKVTRSYKESGVTVATDSSMKIWRRLLCNLITCASMQATPLVRMILILRLLQISKKIPPRVLYALVNCLPKPHLQKYSIELWPLRCLAFSDLLRSAMSPLGARCCSL